MHSSTICHRFALKAYKGSSIQIPTKYLSQYLQWDNANCPNSPCMRVVMCLAISNSNGFVVLSALNISCVSISNKAISLVARCVAVLTSENAGSSHADKAQLSSSLGGTSCSPAQWVYDMIDAAKS